MPRGGCTCRKTKQLSARLRPRKSDNSDLPTPALPFNRSSFFRYLLPNTSQFDGGGTTMQKVLNGLMNNKGIRAHQHGLPLYHTESAGRFCQELTEVAYKKNGAWSKATHRAHLHEICRIVHIFNGGTQTLPCGSLFAKGSKQLHFSGQSRCSFSSGFPLQILQSSLRAKYTMSILRSIGDDRLASAEGIGPAM